MLVREAAFLLLIPSVILIRRRCFGTTASQLQFWREIILKSFFLNATMSNLPLNNYDRVTLVHEKTLYWYYKDKIVDVGKERTLTNVLRLGKLKYFVAGYVSSTSSTKTFSHILCKYLLCKRISIV